MQTHGLKDYGLTGSLPSYLCVISLSLLFCAVRWKKGQGAIYSTITAIVTGSLLYEFFSFSTVRVFDWADVLAIVAGGLTSIIVVRFALAKEDNHAVD